MTILGPDSDVSVVIPVRDGSRFLGAAIASVQAQTNPATEILVIDDGSADNSADIAVACGARCLRTPPQGLARARNAGVAETSSALIAFLDSDDVWMPHKLECQLEVLRSSPSLGFVTAKARIFFEPDAPRPDWMAALQPGGLLPRHLGSTSLMHRKTFEGLGGFDPAWPGSEDFDWMIRADEARIANLEIPEALVHYRLHGANISYGREAQLDRTLDILRASILRRRISSINCPGPDGVDQAGV